MEEAREIKCTLLFSVCLLNTDQAPTLGTPSCTHAGISMRGTFTGFSLASPSTGWSLVTIAQYPADIAATPVQQWLWARTEGP